MKLYVKYYHMNSDNKLTINECEHLATMITVGDIFYSNVLISVPSKWIRNNAFQYNTEYF